MKTRAFFIFAFLIIPCLLASQTILWQYKANGSLWEHFRSIKNISDVNGDYHQDVIAVSENDTLYCFSGIDGTALWKFDADPCYLERGLIAVPDLDGDYVDDVVLGTIWGTRALFALSGASGDTIWWYDSHEHGSGGWFYEVSAMSDIDGDSVVDILAGTGSEPNRAYLFSGATGTKIWESYIGYAVFGIREIGDLNGDSIPDAAISTGNGTSSSYNVFALDGATGDSIWKRSLPGAGWTVVPMTDIDSNGVADMVSGDMAGNVTARSGVDGTPLWGVGIGGTIVDLNILPDVNGNGYDELLPSGTTIYSFRCHDGFDGSTIWTTPAPDQVFALVAIPDITGDGIWDVCGGTGYNTSYFYVMDGATGDTIWTRNMNAEGPVESCWWIQDIDGNGHEDILVGTREGWLYALADGFVGIKEETPSPKKPHTLLFATPNPAHTKTTIEYSIPYESTVSIDIYSADGRKIRTMHDGTASPGLHSIEWNLSGLNIGIYYIRLKVDCNVLTRKVIVLN
jgi:outer membrane protein assembly factor BamB